MDRRNFLKRTTGGMAAVFVALNWEAPEKPSRLALGDENGSFALRADAESIGPAGWADCRIDGKSYCLKKIVGHGTGHCDVVQFKMTLWAEKSGSYGLPQLRELCRSKRLVPIEVRLERPPAITFNGSVFEFGPWEHDVPAIKISVLAKNIRRIM
jgi:hypothetical protein